MLDSVFPCKIINQCLCQDMDRRKGWTTQCHFFLEVGGQVLPLFLWYGRDGNHFFHFLLIFLDHLRIKGISGGFLLLATTRTCICCFIWQVFVVLSRGASRKHHAINVVIRGLNLFRYVLLSLLGRRNSCNTLSLQTWNNARIKQLHT